MEPKESFYRQDFEIPYPSRAEATSLIYSTCNVGEDRPADQRRHPYAYLLHHCLARRDLERGPHVVLHDLAAVLGPDSIEKFWLEFWLEKKA